MLPPAAPARSRTQPPPNRMSPALGLGKPEISCLDTPPIVAWIHAGLRADFSFLRKLQTFILYFCHPHFLHNPSQVAFDLHLLEVWSYLTKRIFIHLLFILIKYYIYKKIGKGRTFTCTKIFIFLTSVFIYFYIIGDQCDGVHCWLHHCVPV